MHDVVAVFPTKVDAWFLALFWGTATACAVGVPFVWRRSVGGALHGGGSVLVSPADEAGFVRALVEAGAPL